MSTAIKRGIIVIVYVIACSLILNWLYSFEVFRSCIVASPECNGYDCVLMGAVLECTPSVWWYLMAGALLVVPVTTWLAVRYTAPKINKKRP